MADEKITDSNLELTKGGDLSIGGKIENGGAENGEKKMEAVISLPEKEVAKEISGSEKDSSYDEIVSKIPQKKDDDHEIKNDAEIILEKKMDAQSNVQHLVDLALDKGVVHAIKVARHMDDNYVLDMLHDKMISEDLHKVLIDKKIITNE